MGFADSLLHILVVSATDMYHENLIGAPLAKKSSFIQGTCNLWNVLPSSCFPESYNLPSLKSRINKLDLLSLSSQCFCSFFPFWVFL